MNALQIWGQDLQKVTFLKRLEGGLVSHLATEYASTFSKNSAQVFGGAPLSKATGHYLAEEGCTLYSLYGMYVSLSWIRLED